MAIPTIEKYGECPIIALAALELIRNPSRGDLDSSGFETIDLAMKYENMARKIVENPSIAWEYALMILDIQKKKVGPDGVESAAGYYWDLSKYAMSLAEIHKPSYLAYNNAKVAHSIHSSLGLEFYGGDHALKEEVVFDSAIPLIMGTEVEKEAYLYIRYHTISEAYRNVAIALNQLDRLDRLGKLEATIRPLSPSFWRNQNHFNRT